MQELRTTVKEAVKKLFDIEIEPQFSRPDEQFGDYSTNVAMQLAPKIGKQPREIAEAIVGQLQHSNIAKAGIAGPGFINIWLTDEALLKSLSVKPEQKLAGKEVLVEFGDPNPFKEMHIGHAYSYIVGDSIASILEAAGAKVHRLSYHGDVGLHVAKAIWGMQESGFNPTEGVDRLKHDLGTYYARGTQAYEKDEKAKSEIDKINQLIYTKDAEINIPYELGKTESFRYFDAILKDLEVHPAERFYESDSADEGLKLVKQHEGEVFEKSDGAIVYRGEKVGLHTRVFITSAGLPTYEAKDLGLAALKKKKYPDASRSIIITAHEQAEYFKVMLAALKEFDKPTAEITTHLYHGFVSLSSGKMSSRTGEVYSVLNLIMDVDEAIKKTFDSESGHIRNAAIKYGFLKHRLGSDIVYDVAESISLEGNSGPYLQYAHARAKSVLAKAKAKPADIKKLEPAERSLVRKISQYPEVIEAAVDELLPSHVCTYLYELAQAFNRFYENNRVVGDEREAIRIKLVEAYANVLAEGLNLLNIEAPERI